MHLVSVTVGNTSTRAVLWRQQHPPQLSHAEEGVQLCSAKTEDLRTPEGIAAFASSLRLGVESMAAGGGGGGGEEKKPTEVVIGGGSVPVVESDLHLALSSSSASLPLFARVWLMHRRRPCPSSHEQEQEALVEELGLRVVPSPAWSVGKDRLCAALGALTLCGGPPALRSHNPHSPSTPGCGEDFATPAKNKSSTAWVVVDSGTALTINVVLPSPRSAWPEVGVFEGGLIMPGEGLMLRSLSSGTAQLPSLTYWPLSTAIPLVGKSTEEAIRAGVRHLHIKGALAVIHSVANDLKQRWTSTASPNDHASLQVRIAVTGGGGTALIEALGQDSGGGGYQYVYDPLLVHRGLQLAWQLQRSKERRMSRGGHCSSSAQE